MVSSVGCFYTYD